MPSWGRVQPGAAKHPTSSNTSACLPSEFLPSLLLPRRANMAKNALRSVLACIADRNIDTGGTYKAHRKIFEHLSKSFKYFQITRLPSSPLAAQGAALGMIKCTGSARRCVMTFVPSVHNLLIISGQVLQQSQTEAWLFFRCWRSILQVHMRCSEVWRRKAGRLGAKRPRHGKDQRIQKIQRIQKGWVSGAGVNATHEVFQTWWGPDICCNRGGSIEHIEVGLCDTSGRRIR